LLKTFILRTDIIPPHEARHLELVARFSTTKYNLEGHIFLSDILDQSSISDWVCYSPYHMKSFHTFPCQDNGVRGPKGKRRYLQQRVTLGVEICHGDVNHRHFPRQFFSQSPSHWVFHTQLVQYHQLWADNSIGSLSHCCRAVS